jgi:opacity protein-like surface antigen
MKLKLIFSVVFVCTLLSASYAQINKGTVWIGSNFSYARDKPKTDQQTNFWKTRTVSILPSFGVAIKENLVLGIFGNYTNVYREQQSTYYYNKREEKIYGGGLFVRRYVPVFKRFYLYGEGRLGYNKSEIEENWANTSASGFSNLKSWETGLTFTPGIAYAITRNILLETGVAALFDARYKNSETKYSATIYTPPYSVKSFTAGVNLENMSAFYVGIRFLINKKV